MPELYRIQHKNQDDIPFALIPSSDIWSFVEYLSFQRVRAHYEPHATFFKVSLPHIDPAAAQQFMDDWRSSQNRIAHEPLAV